MKRIILYYIFLFLLVVTMFNVATAQENGTSPKEVTDPTMTQRLEEDLTFRNSQVVDHPVTWWDTGDAFYGTYSIGGEYMSWYDKEGNYIITVEKKNWNDKDVPASIKSLYNKSLYKSMPVKSYWEVTDQRIKGYYFEIEGDSGKVSRIWANANGKFSINPVRSSSH